jgi:hypothetical protein
MWGTDRHSPTTRQQTKPIRELWCRQVEYSHLWAHVGWPGRRDYKVVRLEARPKRVAIRAASTSRVLRHLPTAGPPERPIADASEVPRQTHQIARDLWPRSVRHPVTSTNVKPLPGLRARPNFKRAIPPLLACGLRRGPGCSPHGRGFFFAIRIHLPPLRFPILVLLDSWLPQGASLRHGLRTLFATIAKIRESCLAHLQCLEKWRRQSWLFLEHWRVVLPGRRAPRPIRLG